MHKRINLNQQQQEQQQQLSQQGNTGHAVLWPGPSSLSK